MRRGYVILLLLFIVIVPVFGHKIESDGEVPRCGIAVYGMGVNAFFDIVVGQTIETEIVIKNTGTIREAVNITKQVSQANTSSVDIVLSNEGFDLEVAESKIVDVALLLLDNESDLVDVGLIVDAIAIQTGGEQIASAGARVDIFLQVNSIACRLSLSVLDKSHFPYARANVIVRRDVLKYAEGLTSDAGNVSFILAKGNYTLEIYDDTLKIQELEIVLEADMTKLVFVERLYVSVYDNPVRYDVVIWVAFLFLGYSIRYTEERLSKRKKQVNTSR